jgi:NAD(P)H-dependent flavin oxidoreductase YrpB (nitropropane dioxygenase family)
VKEEEDMLRTRLCDLLGIDLPIILAGIGAGATSAKFAAVVYNQGGLGGVGSLFRTSDAVKRDIDLLHADQPQFGDRSHPANLGCRRLWHIRTKVRYRGYAPAPSA